LSSFIAKTTVPSLVVTRSNDDRGPRTTRAGGAKKRPTRYDAGEPGPALREALRAHKSGALDRAASAYRAAIEAEGESLDAWMNLGAVEVLRGRGRAAREAFARAAALGPEHARARRDAGIGLSALGLYDGPQGAIAALDAAVRADPGMIGAWLSLARAQLERGDRGAAARAAERAVREAPEDPSARLALFRATFDDGAGIEAALSHARAALALDPGFALARLWCAGALSLAGRDDEARATLEAQASAVDPGMADALAYAMAARREDGSRPRVFSTRREGLLFALEQASERGEVLEFGVRFGVSTRALAEALEREGRGDRVLGFDSFEGLPESWNGLDRGAFSTGGEPPELPSNVSLRVGWFDATIPPLTAELTARDARVRLVHVDSDLYSSARAALEGLAPWISQGCVLVFDELIANGSWRRDEHRALTECARAHGWALDVLALSWITGQGVVRARAAR
jgi:tetratricopeptide (TPR) repeat protein